MSALSTNLFRSWVFYKALATPARIVLAAVCGFAVFAATAVVFSVISPVMAQAPTSQNLPDIPATITAPNNNGIITQGQSGGTNIINAEAPRLQNGLYQKGRFLGTVTGIQVSPDQKEVTLTNIHIAGIGIDLTANLELQNSLISCPSMAGQNNPHTNLSLLRVGDTKCLVIGNKP